MNKPGKPSFFKASLLAALMTILVVKVTAVLEDQFSVPAKFFPLESSFKNVPILSYLNCTSIPCGRCDIR